MSNWLGSAPWKLKMDCFSSPTAKMVRVPRAPFAGEEFLGQLADDAPLLGAGVLRLVDQDVVDAIVELVEHPLRGIAFFQQRQSLHDQIVIIENALAVFHPRVIAAHGGDQGKRSIGEARGPGGAALILDRAETRL